MQEKATARVASLRSGIFVSEEQMYLFYRNFFLLQEAIQKTYFFYPGSFATIHLYIESVFTHVASIYANFILEQKP